MQCRRKASTIFARSAFQTPDRSTDKIVHKDRLRTAGWWLPTCLPRRIRRIYSRVARRLTRGMGTKTCGERWRRQSFIIVTIPYSTTTTIPGLLHQVSAGVASYWVGVPSGNGLTIVASSFVVYYLPTYTRRDTMQCNHPTNQPASMTGSHLIAVKSKKQKKNSMDQRCGGATRCCCCNTLETEGWVVD